MKKNITRVNVDSLSEKDFLNDYFYPGNPVIIEAVSAATAEGEITADYIKRCFGDPSKKTMGWFESECICDDNISVPTLVSNLLSRKDVSVRDTPMRIFMQPAGHVTLPHYDGNSVCGLNLQVLGRKRWSLVSPNTPLPTFPFMFVGLVSKSFRYDENLLDYYEFYTKPGDLLFIPRYWFHEVRSLERCNLNFNWVFSPDFPDTCSLLGRRERELLKIRSVIKPINRLFPDRFDEYAGKGKEITDRYISGVGYLSMLKRLLLEIGKLPKAAYLSRDIRKRVEQFSSNNFNVV